MVCAAVGGGDHVVDVLGGLAAVDAAGAVEREHGLADLPPLAGGAAAGVGGAAGAVGERAAGEAGLYRFEASVTAAGLDSGPDLTPHSLRHGFGSLLLAFGHPLVTVSAWLGHKRTSTTERWYVHQIESMHDEAGDRMRAQMDARETVNAPVNTDPLPVVPAESPTIPKVRS